MASSFTEISFDNIQSQIQQYLQDQYSKANLLFSTSSPYGQILSVVENLFQLSIIYLKNSIQQFDITNPNSVNERIIKNAAIYCGHIPTRSISATGTLSITIKTTTDIENSIPGSRITFKNQQLLFA